MARHPVLRAADGLRKILETLDTEGKGLALQLAQEGNAPPKKRKYRKRSPVAKKSVSTLRKQLKKNVARDKATPQAKGKTRPAQLVD